jgi:hypothetical protein
MKKNIHAQKLAKKRWDKTTKKERSQYGTMMVEARELKKTANNMAETVKETC